MRNPFPAAVLATLVVVAAGCSGGGDDGGGQQPPPGQTPGQLVAVDCAAGAASLAGSFSAPNGATPVANADVTISSAPGCAAKTSVAGQFQFLNVPPAPATVTATKGMFQVSSAATPGATPVALVIPPGAASFAYVTGVFDSIQNILTALGFTPVETFEADLASANLASFDALFLNCGLNETHVADQPTIDALQAYVNGGGTLYASDWAHSYVEAAFPGRVSFLQPSPRVGDATDAPVAAQVLDPSLQAALARTTAQIMFDLGGWAVIDAAPGGTAVLITGPATYLGGAAASKPYAVQFTHGSGRVTYTSFHNEVQATADMQRLLEAMVFGL
jgi:hypothetical protein